MVNLTIEQLELKASEVKKLLDQPAQKFLKTDTLIALYTRAYNSISYQIVIDTDNQTVVTDAIHAITAWQAFGAYGNSISQTLQLQDIQAYEANLRHYKDVASTAAALIGIDLLKLGDNAIPPLSDPVPFISSGGSFLDEDL